MVGKLIFLGMCLCLLLKSGTLVVWAQESPTATPTSGPTAAPTSGPTPTPDTTSKQNDLRNQISELEQKLSETKEQAKTLSAQISAMDSQIKLTQLRMKATEQEIKQLGIDITTTNAKISTLEEALNNITKILMKRIIATYQMGNVQPIQVLMSSDDMSQFVVRANYLKAAQEHDKRLIYDTQQARNDYQNQKDIFESKRKKVEALQVQLETYAIQLNQDKETKKRLLTETQGSEANYQRLLAQAKSQLAAFGRFVTSQGGASLLSNQTVCDDWGCYYNQRDSQWGGMSLNGTQYSLASDGCLVTAMAMVYTHMGHRSVTPVTINAYSGNFASYYPAYLLKTISADGLTTNRISATLDSELSAGRPVIVGISYDGGPIPDHFIVIISGSNGNYRMNDPFTPNGHNIPLTDKYSVGSIKSIEKIVAS